MNLGSLSKFIKTENNFESNYMKQKLMEKEIPCLYHFTDERNIESIRKNGLLPKNMLDDIDFVPGGNEWSIKADKNLGLDRYVHLCLFKNHPMEYLRENNDSDKRKFKWIEIDLSVLDFPGVKYTLDVSNKSGVALLSEQEALEQYDFEALPRLDFGVPGNQKRKTNVEKYEILVPCVIPTDLITIL